jgi:hypothetical protein
MALGRSPKPRSTGARAARLWWNSATGTSSAARVGQWGYREGWNEQALRATMPLCCCRRRELAYRPPSASIAQLAE